MWSRLIKLSRIYDSSYRDWNQRTVIVEQRSLGPNNNFAVDLSQRINAFSPLSFNAAVDAQRIYGTHLVNLADTLLSENRGICVLTVNEVAGTWKVPRDNDKYHSRMGQNTSHKAERQGVGRSYNVSPDMISGVR
jgi:hypothetical protein